MKKILLMIIITILCTGLVLSYVLSPVSKTALQINFEISQGESIKTVAARLEKAGVIKNSLTFILLSKFTGLANKMQAGDFILSPSSLPLDIAKQLTHGEKNIKITIPEGLRKEEIAEILVDKLKIDKIQFLKNTTEGYLFPDTYIFPLNSTIEMIISEFSDNFKQKVTIGLAKNIASQKYSLSEIIILASIIEREVRHDEDRPIVVGILLKRLESDWGLEVDATTQYALGFQAKEKRWWKENLNYADLQIDSPYNTRKYKGLPPSPISNPGLKSIEAVLSPIKTDYWYYISDSKGVNHYAKTLPDHNANIAKYL